MKASTNAIACALATLWIAGCASDTPTARYFEPEGGFLPLPDAYTPSVDSAPPTRAEDGAPPSAPPSSCKVHDVPTTHVYRTAICWAVERGIMQAPGNTFNPDASFTRALMARHLIQIKYKGSPPAAPTSPSYTDVAPTHPHFGPIQQLAADGIAKGCNVAGTMFCPEALASNAHGASLSVRLKYKAQPFILLSSTPYFTDVPTTHWGFSTIQKQHEDKAAVPCGSSTLYCPDQPITRGKWAQVLYSYFGP